MSDPELVREVARWLRHARDDLTVAELILDHGQVPRAACFNAQQCAEKAIKGSLVFLQIPFRKIHDLEALCKELPDGWSLAEDPARLSDLSEWAVEPRYPGDLPGATEADAKAAVEEARDAYETTPEDLARHGYSPPDEV
ncbi:MAG: HEPN domain-containing protein [Actinomycetota bacterium]|jgi:HEPN domain-containing protein|nr:HEPN domain-containing protein [Rubrobacter sp.]MDQ3509199.1 HEPN domain-containing protein [Actinomycetota bacterium]